MTVREWLDQPEGQRKIPAPADTPLPRGRIIKWREIAIAKGAQLGFTDAKLAALKARAKPSRRLRLPFGRRETLADILAGWIATSSQVKRGTLTEEHKLASMDRLGGEMVPDYKHPEARVWRAGRPYNRLGVDVFLRMVRSPLTQRNTRRGWRPDGTEIAS